MISVPPCAFEKAAIVFMITFSSSLLTLFSRTSQRSVSFSSKTYSKTESSLPVLKRRGRQ